MIHPLVRTVHFLHDAYIHIRDIRVYGASIFVANSTGEVHTPDFSNYSRYHLLSSRSIACESFDDTIMVK